MPARWLSPAPRVVGLGIDARRALSSKQIAELSRWRTRDEQMGLVIGRTKAVRPPGTSGGRARRRRIEANTAIAAITLNSCTYPGRVPSEAALTALAGRGPIPASSRNNRNRALAMATVTRMTHGIAVRLGTTSRTA